MSYWHDCPLPVARLLFFDIETTGLRPDRGARISEIAVLGPEGLVLEWSHVPADTGSTYSADGEHRPPDRKSQPGIAQHLKALHAHLQTGVVVGHNLSFDFRFVTYEAERLGLGGLTLRYIDTLGLARTLIPDADGYQLSTLVTHAGLSLAGPLHTATGDVRATRALFWHLVDRGGLDTLGDAGLKQLTWTVS
jgi:DNA polymerase III alpha subunit (gram-positive type)